MGEGISSHSYLFPPVSIGGLSAVVDVGRLLHQPNHAGLNISGFLLSIAKRSYISVDHGLIPNITQPLLVDSNPIQLDTSHGKLIDLSSLNGSAILQKNTQDN